MGDQRELRRTSSSGARAQVTFEDVNPKTRRTRLFEPNSSGSIADTQSRDTLRRTQTEPFVKPLTMDQRHGSVGGAEGTKKRGLFSSVRVLGRGSLIVRADAAQRSNSIETNNAEGGQKRERRRDRYIRRISQLFGLHLEGYQHASDPDKAWEVEVLPVPDPHTLPRPENSIRIVCISDTHGHTLDNVPDGDILIHAGDFSKIGEKIEVERFNEWLGILPHPHKIVVAGNHDIAFDTDHYENLWRRFHKMKRDCVRIKASLTNCTYLEDSGVELYGYKFYGSPWQPKFHEWAFNQARGKPLRLIWEKLPAETDILITHGPPVGYGDLLSTGRRAGDVDLLYHVQNRVRPLYHIFGHIHEAYGLWTDGTTTYINASTCTLRYKPDNHAIVFDLPRDRDIAKPMDVDRSESAPVRASVPAPYSSNLGAITENDSMPGSRQESETLMFRATTME